MLHGKMSAEEKAAVLDSFKRCDHLALTVTVIFEWFGHA
jgi:RecG-like helicase